MGRNSTRFDTSIATSIACVAGICVGGASQAWAGSVLTFEGLQNFEQVNKGQSSIAVMGAHTSTKSGSFPIAITLTDKQGNTVTDNQTATVSNPLVIQALPVTAHLRQRFRGQVARCT